MDQFRTSIVLQCRKPYYEGIKHGLDPNEPAAWDHCIVVKGLPLPRNDEAGYTPYPKASPKLREIMEQHQAECPDHRMYFSYTTWTRPEAFFPFEEVGNWFDLNAVPELFIAPNERDAQLAFNARCIRRMVKVATGIDWTHEQALRFITQSDDPGPFSWNLYYDLAFHKEGAMALVRAASA
jgi:hypothetical protein